MVTSGGVMWVLLRHLGNTLADGIIDNAAYIKVRSDGIDFFLEETQGIRTT